MMKWVEGGVTAAEGFQASGVSAGIKRSRKPDVALVVATQPATAVGVLTKNRVKAAPVLISQRRLVSARAQAIFINSGCANCMTGEEGLQDALHLSHQVAQALQVPDREVLVASTGMIGRRLPVPRIQRVIPSLAAQLSRAHHQAAAQAILTTDLQVKEAAVETTLNGRRVRVGGMAKGAGMIAPSMATMLCVITTDVSIDAALFRSLLRQATDVTFNRISVDGDMSTNDTVFALASGRSGVKVRAGHRTGRVFFELLRLVMEQLALLIVRDGEGATRIMEVHVKGARTDAEAKRCARVVASSPLVKTMLAGGDPNVGRIAAAVGASSACFDPRALDIYVGTHQLVRSGVAVRIGKSLARELFVHPQITVIIQLHAGRAEARMLTCDLTERYVQINARYSGTHS